MARTIEFYSVNLNSSMSKSIVSPSNFIFACPFSLVYFLLPFVLCFLLQACGGAGTPLDAGTRQAIDSIASAEIRQARIDIDSLCKMERTTTLPRLVDSIKQKRIREIQEQLKTVPR